MELWYFSQWCRMFDLWVLVKVLSQTKKIEIQLKIVEHLAQKVYINVGYRTGQRQLFVEVR